MKKLFLGILLCSCITSVYAQTNHPIDTTQYKVVNSSVEEQSIEGNKHQVISNRFKDNWFVLADFGANTYWGDYTSNSKFMHRMSPQFNVGFGKWILPGYGVKFQFIGMNSRADKWVQGNFTDNSQQFTDSNGNPYWRENAKWLNVNLDFMFNLSRLIKGYEGNDSDKLMNQFYATVGLGATFPLLEKGTAHDFATHVELQYSRFFSEKKNISLDVKLRSILQTTQFDGVCEQFLDDNYSVNIGVTYYFKDRGWKRSVSNTTYYVEDYKTINQLNQEIADLKNAQAQAPDTVIVMQAASPELITFPYLVNFVIDKVEVVNRERVNLAVIAEMMLATPDQKYLICGYADKYTGSVKRNIWLAEHRAKNVFKVLTKEFGVPASQLVLDDKGGVDNMFYNDPQLSRSAIITRYEE